MWRVVVVVMMLLLLWVVGSVVAVAVVVVVLSVALALLGCCKRGRVGYRSAQACACGRSVAQVVSRGQFPQGPLNSLPSSSGSGSGRRVEQRWSMAYEGGWC